jgi:peptidoglycan/LPS O-acetylase OafA/YrhL
MNTKREVVYSATHRAEIEDYPLVLVLVLTILLASWSWHFFERQFIAVGKPHIVSG